MVLYIKLGVQAVPVTDPKRSSYVRVAREALATNHVEKFREKLEDMSWEYLPSRGSTHRRIARTAAELRREGTEPQLRTIGIPTATIYPTNGMRVTLFERRLPRSQRSNSSLIRLLGRLAELDMLLLADTPSPKTITITSNRIVETTARMQDPTRREFSLAIDPSPTLHRLVQEYSALHEFVGKNANRTAEQMATEDPWADARVLPIFAIPRWADPIAVSNFVERVNIEGGSGPLVTLDLNIPELHSKIR